MPEQDAQKHRAALERFYDAFNARDLGRMLAEMHPEIEFESRFARGRRRELSGPRRRSRLACRSG
jgi:hypothetical protein